MGKKEMVHSKVIVCKSWVQDSPLGLKNKVSKLLLGVLKSNEVIKKHITFISHIILIYCYRFYINLLSDH